MYAGFGQGDGGGENIVCTPEAVQAVCQGYAARCAAGDDVACSDLGIERPTCPDCPTPDCPDCPDCPVGGGGGAGGGGDGSGYSIWKLIGVGLASTLAGMGVGYLVWGR